MAKSSDWAGQAPVGKGEDHTGVLQVWVALRWYGKVLRRSCWLSMTTPTAQIDAEADTFAIGFVERFSTLLDPGRTIPPIWA